MRKGKSIKKINLRMTFINIFYLLQNQSINKFIKNILFYRKNIFLFGFYYLLALII